MLAKVGTAFLGENPNMKIILANKDFGYGVQPQRMQGMSGSTYGISRYSPQHLCHIIEMPLTDWLKCRGDVHRSVGMRMRCWYPWDIVIPDAVQQFAQGYEAGLDKRELPEGATFATQSGWTAAHAETAEVATAITQALEETRAKLDISQVQRLELGITTDFTTGSFADSLPGKPEVINTKTPFMKLRQMAKLRNVWREGMKSWEIVAELNKQPA